MEWIGTMKATGFQWCNEGNWKLIQNTGTRAFTVAFQITRSPSCSSSVSTGFFFLCLSYRLSLPATAGTGTCSLAVLLDRPWNFTENDRFDFVFFSLPFHYFHFICLTAAFMDISADGRVVFFFNFNMGTLWADFFSLRWQSFMISCEVFFLFNSFDIVVWAGKTYCCPAISDFLSWGCFSATWNRVENDNSSEIFIVGSASERDESWGYCASIRNPISISGSLRPVRFDESGTRLQWHYFDLIHS